VQTGFFTGLGIVIVLLAGMALGRFSVIGVRETRQAERAAKARAEREAAARETAPRTEPVTTSPDAPASTAPKAPASTAPKAPASTEPKAPASTAPEPVATQPNATTGPRRFIPGRKTSADTGTTPAETKPDDERADSSTAAH
jgi:hypothetical protein